VWLWRVRYARVGAPHRSSCECGRSGRLSIVGHFSSCVHMGSAQTCCGSFLHIAPVELLQCASKSVGFWGLGILACLVGCILCSSLEARDCMDVGFVGQV
jgi:hypothetical protein